MSIVTKTGDDGTTGLMYNRRVSKCHPRVEAYAAVDELTAAIGLARALTPKGFVTGHLSYIQKELITLMGELATLPEDLERSKIDGYGVITAANSASLEILVNQIEAKKIAIRGWAIPGDTVASATLDLARVACRKAERQAWRLHEAGQLGNSNITTYLNRLSDTLWLCARLVESEAV